MTESEKKLSTLIKSDITISQTRVNGFDINYLTAGSGRPLLLLHGLNLGWGQWFLNIDSFAKHNTVIAIDLPGSGNSGKVNFRKLNLERDYLQTVHDFIKHLKLEDLCIVGHSLGGWIALKLALEKNSLIDKLIIEDSMGFTNFIPLQQRLLLSKIAIYILSHIDLKPTRRELEKFLIKAFYEKIHLPDELIDYYFNAVSRGKAAHPLLFMQSLAEELKNNDYLNLEKQLKKIHQPTLIITGEKDQTLPLEHVLPNFKLIPNVSIKTLLNTGHVPSLEKSEEFNSIVNKFLSRY